MFKVEMYCKKELVDTIFTGKTDRHDAAMYVQGYLQCYLIYVSNGKISDFSFRFTKE